MQIVWKTSVKDGNQNRLLHRVINPAFWKGIHLGKSMLFTILQLQRLQLLFLTNKSRGLLDKGAIFEIAKVTDQHVTRYLTESSSIKMFWYILVIYCSYTTYL